MESELGYLRATYTAEPNYPDISYTWPPYIERRHHAIDARGISESITKEFE
jgi:hypothetical protein